MPWPDCRPAMSSAESALISRDCSPAYGDAANATGPASIQPRQNAARRVFMADLLRSRMPVRRRGKKRGIARRAEPARLHLERVVPIRSAAPQQLPQAGRAVCEEEQRAPALVLLDVDALMGAYP